MKVETVTTSGNLSNWRELIARGQNATTTLTGTRYTYAPPRFRYSVHHKFPSSPSVPSNTYIYAYLEGNPVVFGPSVPDALASVSLAKADAAALGRYVQKLVSARSSMQGGVLLGELKKTIVAVMNPARSIRNGIDDYLTSLKKKRRNVARTAPPQRRKVASQIVTDTWLEYSFGWVPLFSDAKGAAEALAKSQILPERPMSVFVSASAKDSTGRSKFNQVAQHSAGGLYATTSLSAETYYSVKYYGKVHVSHPNSLQAQLGLLPEDFVPTVWELVPWSFLVDYFSNVGDIIQAASLLNSYPAWTSRGHKFSTEYSLRTEPSHIYGSNYYLLGSGSNGKLSVTQVTRAPYVGSLIPPLRFELPGFGRKWINMGALANSLRSLQPFHRL